MLEPLEESDWRIFRISMREMQDADLAQFARELYREMRQRQELESSLTRLFLSSLSTSDLQHAAAEILKERAARLNDVRRLRQLSRSTMPPKAARPRRPVKRKRF